MTNRYERAKYQQRQRQVDLATAREQVQELRSLGYNKSQIGRLLQRSLTWVTKRINEIDDGAKINDVRSNGIIPTTESQAEDDWIDELFRSTE